MNDITKPTKRKIVTKNFILYLLNGIFYNTAILFMQDSILQTFLHYYGVSDHLIGIYTTLLNIINVTVMIFSSPISDRSKNAASAIAKLTVPIGICFFGFLPVCFVEGMSATMVFVIALVIGMTQFLFSAIRDVFVYKLPYQIIDMRDYHLLVAVNGVIYGLVGIGVSYIFAKFTELYKYEYVMAGAFAFAAVCMFLDVITNARYKIKEIQVDVPKDEKKKSAIALGALIKLPEFRSLIIPNFFRGVATGTISMLALLALSTGFTETDVAYLVTIRSVANIAGSLLFAVISSKINSRFLCLISSAMMLSMPFLAIPNKGLFYAIYFTVIIAKIIVDYSVPTIIYRIIHYEIAGSYHSWRLLIMNAGVALATYVVGVISDYAPNAIPYLLAGAAVAQLISGLVYCFAKPIRTNSPMWLRDEDK